MKKEIKKIQCPKCGAENYEIIGKVKNTPKWWQVLIAVIINAMIAPFLTGVFNEWYNQLKEVGNIQPILYIIGFFMIPTSIIITIAVFKSIKRKTKCEYRCKDCGKIWQIG